MPGSHQILSGRLTGADQITRGLFGRVGIRTDTISSSRSNRARRRASRASVFTRSPARRCSFDDAATAHRHPAAIRARARPNPVGPDS
jgi:hypothetical protein